MNTPRRSSPPLRSSEQRREDPASTELLRLDGVRKSFGHNVVLRDVDLDVPDDGRTGAAHPPVAGGGHGLVGIKERVALYGGTVEVGPMAEHGFRVHARIPVRP